MLNRFDEVTFAVGIRFVAGGGLTVVGMMVGKLLVEIPFVAAGIRSAAVAVVAAVGILVVEVAGFGILSVEVVAGIPFVEVEN